MNLDKYIRELNLIEKQNPYEYDLYHIVYMLINNGKNMESLSVRDVHKRQRSNKGQVFYGLSSFPDFIIADETFDKKDNNNGNVDNIDKIYGCIEVKPLNKKLVNPLEVIEKINKDMDIIVEEEQILGEVLWYNKIIYTNGYIWKYIHWTPSYNDKQYIKQLVIDRINQKKSKEDAPSWYKKIPLENWRHYKEKIQIEEMLSLLDKNKIMEQEQWKKFLKHLHKIQWS